MFSIDFGGTLGGFISSIFALVSDLLQGIFSALTGIVDGINVTIL
jgi:hypothetical protein